MISWMTTPKIINSDLDNYSVSPTYNYMHLSCKLLTFLAVKMQVKSNQPRSALRCAYCSWLSPFYLFRSDKSCCSAENKPVYRCNNLYDNYLILLFTYSVILLFTILEFFLSYWIISAADFLPVVMANSGSGSKLGQVLWKVGQWCAEVNQVQD